MQRSPSRTALKTLQAASMILSGLLVPVAFVGKDPLTGNKSAIAFLVSLYISALIAIGSTLLRYVREDRIILPSWRRGPYAASLMLLIVFCLLPIATWPLAFSGKWAALHPPRVLLTMFLILFGAQVVAAILLWFGRGWSRVGLTVVNFWLCFLWVFPLGVGV